MSDLIFNSPLLGDVAVIPYPFAEGATEALEFYTDVVPAYTNEAEERSQLRALPRQYFKQTYDASFGYMNEISTAMRAGLRGRWLIPLWFESQPAQSSVGQTVFPADTLVHDLRANSHVLLWKSLCEWQIVQCFEITDTTITVAESVIDGPVLVVPCRVGRVSGRANLSPTGYSNRFELEYYVEDVLAGLTESPSQLAGHDLYTDPYIVDGDGSGDIDQQPDEVDFVVGGIDTTTPWPWSVYTRSYGFDEQGAEAYYGLKKWFYRRAGKYRPFFSPTFESDLQKRSTGNITNLFQYRNEGYADRIFPHMKRLGFKLRDGSWLFRTATAAENLDTFTGQVTLDTALNVHSRDIMLVSLVSLNRLNTDRLEISLGQLGRFTATASVMEVPE